MDWILHHEIRAGEVVWGRDKHYGRLREKLGPRGNGGQLSLPLVRDGHRTRHLYSINVGNYILLYKGDWAGSSTCKWRNTDISSNVIYINHLCLSVNQIWNKTIVKSSINDSK